MSEEKPVLNLGAPAPPKEDPKPGGEPSQDELNWVSQLSSDLKVDKSLSKFKTLDDMARAYKQLESKLGSEVPVNINEKSTYEDHVKLFESVHKVNKENYAPEGVDETVMEIGKELAIPASVLSRYEAKRAEVVKKSSDEKTRDLELQYKEKLRVAHPDGDELNRRLELGLSAVSMTKDTYIKTFGVEAYNPEIVNNFILAGKVAHEEETAKIKDGRSTGGLPDDVEILKARSKQISSTLPNSTIIQQRELREEQKLITAKLQKAMDDAKTSARFV